MRCKGRPFCGVIYTIKERCFLPGVVPQCDYYMRRLKARYSVLRTTYYRLQVERRHFPPLPLRTNLASVTYVYL
jgi:hypothetical protein